MMPIDDQRSQTGPVRSADRIPALETIRALAAFQVLLLHLLGGFVPALVFPMPQASALANWIRSSPFAYVYDGSSAVYVFFALSGLVLTAPFVRDGNRPARVIAARWVRLAMPAVAACVLALVMLALWPSAHVEAGAITGSYLLAKNWLPDIGFVAFWRDAILSALFTGYETNGAIAALGLHPFWLPPINGAYVAPLWTISVEFAGSLMVLTLAICWRHSSGAWVLAAGVTALVLARTPYLCFVVGHLVGLAIHTGRSYRPPPVACIFGIALGIHLCTTAEYGAFAACRLNVAGWPPCAEPWQFQEEIGALVVFLSAITWRDGMRFLSLPRLALFGRLSFPVYLVHWPIVFGLCSAVYLLVLSFAGRMFAVAAVLIVGIGATLVAALAFVWVDTFAKRLSRRVRDYRAGLAELAR